MSQPFDFDKALKALQSGQALTGNAINQTVNRSRSGR
ncbi:Transposase for insertion sequence element ISRM3 [Salmonella enterica subsp. enterica]|nr:Transposase for insertion sequence element ISRM3 [Salmonella enterica subsp. enterica]